MIPFLGFRVSALRDPGVGDFPNKGSLRGSRDMWDQGWVFIKDSMGAFWELSFQSSVFCEGLGFRVKKKISPPKLSIWPYCKCHPSEVF